MVRAVLEGVAYGLRDSLEIFNEMGVDLTQIRLSGGGAKNPAWRPILADVFNRECVTINIDEGPAFGVALLAGVGTGIYPSVQQACKQTIKVEQRIEPTPKNARVYERYYPIFRRLYANLKDEFAALAQAYEGTGM
jgi:xylulokinase